MEAVPIARVVFVVRVPVLDKEREAKPTASVLPAFQGLDSVKTWPQEEGGQPPRLVFLPLNSGEGPVALPEGSDHLAIQERTHRWVYKPTMEKGLSGYGRNWS